MQVQSAHRHNRQGFTLMEILVVIAIISVLAAIIFPVVARMKANSHKVDALSRMKALNGAVATYASQNNGDMPSEDILGSDNWESVKKPGAEKAWYIALPKILNQKSMADFVKENRPAGFYTAESSVWLPGAHYPEGKKLAKPYFAIAINTKLHRKNKEGLKSDLKLSNIQAPGRTVVFLERGLPGEEKAHPTISTKSDYDGACKASGKAFVARYTGRGMLAFADGHVAEFAGSDLLTNTGELIWDEQSAANSSLGIIWTADPKEDPNAKPK